MSEPHISKPARSGHPAAPTKGGSFPRIRAIPHARRTFPVPIAVEVLIEDAAVMHEVALSDADLWPLVLEPPCSMRGLSPLSGCQLTAGD